MPGLNPLQFRPDAAADLRRIEVCLLDSVKADDALLTEIASHLIPAGGKRLRPSFVAAPRCSRGRPAGPASLTDDSCGARSRWSSSTSARCTTMT